MVEFGSQESVVDVTFLVEFCEEFSAIAWGLVLDLHNLTAASQRISAAGVIGLRADADRALDRVGALSSVVYSVPLSSRAICLQADALVQLSNDLRAILPCAIVDTGPTRAPGRGGDGDLGLGEIARCVLLAAEISSLAARLVLCLARDLDPERHCGPAVFAFLLPALWCAHLASVPLPVASHVLLLVFAALAVVLVVAKRFVNHRTYRWSVALAAASVLCAVPHWMSVVFAVVELAATRSTRYRLLRERNGSRESTTENTEKIERGLSCRIRRVTG